MRTLALYPTILPFPSLHFLSLLGQFPRNPPKPADTAIDHPGITHDRIRAHLYTPHGILSICDTSASHNLHIPTQPASILADEIQRLWQLCRPTEAADLLCGDTFLLLRGLRGSGNANWAGDRSISDYDAGDTRVADGGADVVDLVRRVGIGGDLHDYFGLAGSGGDFGGGGDDGGEELCERLCCLEDAEAGRVGGGDVHHDDVGVGSELLDALDVVALDGGEVGFWGSLVFPDLDGEDAAGVEGGGEGGVSEDCGFGGSIGQGVAADSVAETSSDDVGADTVEAVAVDEAAGGGEAEEARTGIAVLRAGGHTAHFDEADRRGEREERVDAFRMLIEAGGDPEWCIDVEAPKRAAEG